MLSSTVIFTLSTVSSLSKWKLVVMLIVSTLNIFNRANALTKYLYLRTCEKVCFWPYCSKVPSHLIHTNYHRYCSVYEIHTNICKHSYVDVFNTYLINCSCEILFDIYFGSVGIRKLLVYITVFIISCWFTECGLRCRVMWHGAYETVNCCTLLHCSSTALKGIKLNWKKTLRCQIVSLFHYMYLTTFLT